MSERTVSRIIEQLSVEGFTIHRYDSFSTTSVYLKLDYGLANTIRIADHKGKEKYTYRFNVMENIQERYTDDQGRHYYTPQDVESLIIDVVEGRQEKLNKYGQRAYNRIYEDKKATVHEHPGFWQSARQV